jgi:hypothetical protein
MTSIVPFISNAIFEASDIELMSDAYDRAIEDVYRFGRPNKVVEKLIDPKELRERALAVCGFNPAILMNDLADNYDRLADAKERQAITKHKLK